MNIKIINNPPPPYSLCHEIYNFGKPFLGHHNYKHALILSDLCLGVEKIFTEKMHFHFLPYLATP